MSLPDAPVFLLQQTYQRRGDLAPVAAAQASAGNTPPGLLLDFGAVPLDGLRDDAGQAGQFSALLACSAQYGSATKHKKPMAPWVQRDAPSSRSDWTRLIDEALVEQRSLGFTALSVPGIELSTAGYPNDLERQVDAIARAWTGRSGSDPTWFAHLCFHDDWLTDEKMRRLALNLATDLPDDIGIALHIRFARDAISSADTLGGLRQVVSALADDGRRVLLVQSGLLGWLSLAWGAWGFSAGMSAGSWLDSRAIFRRRAGAPAPPRLERYVEPQLLHSVLWDDHSRFAQEQAHVPCACPFCRQLGTGWNNNTSGQHGLYALADLTQRVTASDRAGRRDLVRRAIEDAQNQWASWHGLSGLSPRAQAPHLAVWRSLI